MTDQPQKARPIFSRNADPDRVMSDLQALTQATRQSHKVHDFLFQGWGKAIVNLTPYPETGNAIAEVYLHSPIELNNGDMLVTGRSDGRQLRQFLFDVEKQDNPGDLYKAHVAIGSPSAGVGHP